MLRLARRPCRVAGFVLRRNTLPLPLPLSPSPSPYNQPTPDTNRSHTHSLSGASDRASEEGSGRGSRSDGEWAGVPVGWGGVVALGLGYRLGQGSGRRTDQWAGRLTGPDVGTRMHCNAVARVEAPAHHWPRLRLQRGQGGGTATQIVTWLGRRDSDCVTRIRRVMIDHCLDDADPGLPA